ncbi:MAG: oligosaccharide flippase family protein [Terriglobales bacterium]
MIDTQTDTNMKDANEAAVASGTVSPVVATAAASAAVSTKKLRSKLLGGTLTLLAGSGFVGLTNLIYNVATARLLGPAGFAHATAVYTMLMLMSAVTLSFQTVCAKYVARYATTEDRIAVFVSLHQRAWAAGIGLGLVIFLFGQALTHYLNLPDLVLVRLMALGTVFYIPLGVRRGYIQGIHAFKPLAINFMLEGLVRLVGVVLLTRLGMGVKGAVLASVLAIVVSYFFAFPTPSVARFNLRRIPGSFREGLQAIVFFSSQTVINNFDIILVKHFFPPDEAGLYAAVALVGRLVNMCAWSVVNTMFPVSAAADPNEKEDRSVLFLSFGMVFVILTVLTFGLWMIPNFLWKTLFGAHFALANYGALASLLILYAITTGVYSLSSVIITYEMSRKIANTSWLQLAFSAMLILGVYTFHQTLHQVIVVQLALMVVLLLTLLIPLLLHQATSVVLNTYGSLRLLRPLSEEEVIADFLKSEFHHSEFDGYRSEFEQVVNHPDITNPKENAVRRALLFLRRGAMWRELPLDTKWFEVELTTEDLARIRFFPRAQWRRVARGSFYLTDVVERIRQKLEGPVDDEFLQKLRRVSNGVQECSVNPTVLLIGAGDKSPLTILDGNHRVAAGMLSKPPVLLNRFQFVCGLSPDMTKCCWYYTSVNTLMRYFKNLVRYFSYDPESDIGRFLEMEGDS